MTITLYAQPYDLAATGFYFENYQTFETRSAALRNDYGDPVEEFEIQFIDGDVIDAALFKTIGVHQGDIELFFEHAAHWEEWQKINILIAVGECGYSFDLKNSDPDDFDVQIYNVDSLRELAVEFVNDGVFGEIPDHLANYIDMEAIAADLRYDYTETVIAGTPIVYRCE